MSIATSGASGSYFYRNSGTVTSTGTLTTAFWIKRTADLSGLKTIWTIRPNPETSGHDLIINDPAEGTAHLPTLQVNWASQQAKAASALALNAWTFMVVQGSGSNISIKVWDGSAYSTVTVAQTAFNGARERWGDAGAGTQVFTGLFAYIRQWNAVLSEAELTSERTSATVVRTSNLVSNHSGGGGNITAALTGESGTAYTNGGGATYSTDMPTFSSFTGTVISGDAQMPTESVGTGTGTRYNRVIYSGELEQAIWTKQGNTILSSAVLAPAGYGQSKRIRIDVDSGGVYQLMPTVPEGLHTASVAVRRVDTDYAVLRMMSSSFNVGAQGHFNVNTGAWTVTNNFGGTTSGAWGFRPLSNGWFLIWISASVGTQVIIEVFPIFSSGTQTPAVGRSLDVAGFQLEAGGAATYHKPTQSVAVFRSLVSGSMDLASTTIAVGQETLATLSLIDSAGAPWDQHGPITFTSSNTAVATFDPYGTITDTSGRLSATVNAISNGTSNIGANDGSITASTALLTVSGTGTGTRLVEILTEDGWQSTGGWFVAVYQRHSTARFPTTKLFEATGQSFQSTAVNGQSRMVVQVPSTVSVTAGQIVEVVLENDNIAGAAVDGPGIFTATVI